MRRLGVESAGIRTTVEDRGRRGVGRFGVPPGGAFDEVALVAANRLVGNPPDAAGLEIALRGPVLRNVGDEPLRVACTGAALPAAVEDAGSGAPSGIRPGGSALLPPGACLRLDGTCPGARAWLAVEGGIDVERVLGSRSTHVASGEGGFGGLGGRGLRRGDELRIGAPPGLPSLLAFDDPLAAAAGPAGDRRREVVRLRILPGPQREEAPGALAWMVSARWIVARDSDRVGVRLDRLPEPGADPRPGSGSGELSGPPGMLPEGTTLGAVQLPPDGRPIVLGPDRPTTGGYAKPALVARADVGRLALLRPGDRVRFEAATLEEAERLLALRWRAAGGRP